MPNALPPTSAAARGGVCRSTEHLLLKVWLPLAELSSSLFGSYAVYTINVAWDGGGHATVKRYSDFSGLHKSVCRHGFGPFVEFPSKVRPHACTRQRMHEYFTGLGSMPDGRARVQVVFNNTSNAVVEQRRQMFEMYVLSR